MREISIASRRCKEVDRERSGLWSERECLGHGAMATLSEEHNLPRVASIQNEYYVPSL